MLRNGRDFKVRCGASVVVSDGLKVRDSFASDSLFWGVSVAIPVSNSN